MKLTVYFQGSLIDENHLKGKTVVVVDVLRATSTICAALMNGAREIIPVVSLESATKIASNLFYGQYLLGGERQGKMIEGFDLGNSPVEYSPEKVNTKSIVFSTTNGTVSIHRSRYAERVYIGGFVNLEILLSTLTKQIPEDLVIVCAGKENVFCIEDALCAGAIIQNLTMMLPNIEIILTDAGRTSKALWLQLSENLQHEIRYCDHGKYLSSIGFENDVAICSTLNRFPVLPYLKDGSTLKLWSDDQPKFKKVDLV